MNDETKSPAEMKQIRLNRKLAQEVEGAKAMAGHRGGPTSRYENARRRCARCGWQRKPPTVTSPASQRPRQSETQQKEIG